MKLIINAENPHQGPFTEQPRLVTAKPRITILTHPGLTSAQRINLTSGETEYYTPPNIIEAARAVMGSIELDPASSAQANARIGAARYFTEEINGLAQPWVTPSLWMNHPYGKSEQKCAPNCRKKTCARRGFHSEAFKPGNTEWINKLVEEYECGNVKQACCITFASTSEKWFRPLLKQPQCFLYGRISFILPNGEPLRGNTKGSVVTYFGRNVAKFAAEFEKLGQIKVPYGF